MKSFSPSDVRPQNALGLVFLMSLALAPVAPARRSLALARAMFVSGLTRPSLFSSSRSGEEDEEGVEEPKKDFGIRKGKGGRVVEEVLLSRSKLLLFVSFGP